MQSYRTIICLMTLHGQCTVELSNLPTIIVLLIALQRSLKIMTIFQFFDRIFVTLFLVEIFNFIYLICNTCCIILVLHTSAFLVIFYCYILQNKRFHRHTLIIKYNAESCAIYMLNNVELQKFYQRCYIAIQYQFKVAP